MDDWMQWLLAIVQGIPVFFKSPFPYILLLLIFLQWKRQVDMERKLYSAKLHTVAEGVFQSVFYGILGGAFASIALVGLGVMLHLDTLIYLWIVALVLMIFQVRYLCFAYSGAFVGLFALLAGWFPQGHQISWLQPLWGKLLQIDLVSLFAFVAILHLTEAFLVFLNGSKCATPVFIQSKRGRLIGAYHIQQIWFVPVLAVVIGGQETLPPLYQGWPLVSSFEQWIPFSLLLVPAVLGFSDQAVSSTPKQKERQAIKYLSGYSLVLVALLFGAVYLTDWFLLATVLFSFLGHEGMSWYSQWREVQHAPRYVNPRNGIRILAVIPGTPAERMELKPEEVIHKVNGHRVYERKNLYEAMQTNMAFCRLEVMDEKGMVRFAKSSIYQKDHHQLGIILAPDERVPYYKEQKEISLWRLLRNRLLKKRIQNQDKTLAG